MKTHPRPPLLSVVCAALLAAAPSMAAGPAWADAEMEDFLLRAEIERVETLSLGVTRSKRATLSLDGRSHDAHIQTVDVLRHKTEVRGRPVLGFRDSYRYNVAAYRLDRLLGLGMVPVSVARTVGGRPAAVTWWVDDVLMMEKDRLAKHVAPPDPASWTRQVQRKRLFDQLISNIDSNQGNLLIARDWKVWLVDFTRAFRRDRKPSDPASLVRIESALLERLRGLTREQIARRLGDSLTAAELGPLLARRDAIVRHFDREIARRGAAAVLADAPEPAPATATGARRSSTAP